LKDSFPLVLLRVLHSCFHVYYKKREKRKRKLGCLGFFVEKKA